MSWKDALSIFSTVINGGWPTWIAGGVAAIGLLIFTLWFKKWRNDQIEAGNIKKKEERQASTITENQTLENRWDEATDRLEEKRKELSAGKTKKKRETQE